MNDPLVLDTCSFSDKSFLNLLKIYHGDKFLPSVAYAELVVDYYFNKNKNPDHVDKLLRKLNIEVEWLDASKAKNAVLCCQDKQDFKDHIRDYLIGAHAFPAPRIMITNNIKDFECLVQSKVRLFTTFDFCRMLERKK